MKKTIILAFFIAMSVLLMNCNKEEPQKDLTTEITGIYIGIFKSVEFDAILPYEVTVSKVSNTKIKVGTEKEIEFKSTEFEIFPLNGDEKVLTSSTNEDEHLVNYIRFGVSDTVTSLRFEILPLTEINKFWGTKK